ncbi:hypothetical protein DP127_08640 [Clostridium tetani]|nr:hypothetical protein DP127_08640 [Clostridium tetani]
MVSTRKCIEGLSTHMWKQWLGLKGNTVRGIGIAGVGKWLKWDMFLDTGVGNGIYFLLMCKTPYLHHEAFDNTEMCCRGLCI